MRRLVFIILFSLSYSFNLIALDESGITEPAIRGLMSLYGFSNQDECLQDAKLIEISGKIRSIQKESSLIKKWWSGKRLVDGWEAGKCSSSNMSTSCLTSLDKTIGKDLREVLYKASCSVPVDWTYRLAYAACGSSIQREQGELKENISLDQQKKMNASRRPYCTFESNKKCLESSIDIPTKFKCFKDSDKNCPSEFKDCTAYTNTVSGSSNRIIGSPVDGDDGAR